MPGTKLILKVMRDECLGDGACADAAPGTFEINGEGIACVRSAITDSTETILKTARACPTDAIVVIDAETGDQLVPAP
jgi:ferredoxin